MRKHLYLLIATLTIAMLSCKKEPLTYQIEGTVTDLNSKEAVGNITVKLSQKEYKNGVLSNNYTFVDEISTDINGQYSFTIDRSKIYEIKIEVENTNYYFHQSIYSSSLLKTDETNVFDEKIESKSWLSLIIKNEYIGPNEQLNINKSKFKEGCEACCSNGTLSLFETGDTTIVCATVGFADVILNYGVVGSNNQVSKTITCVPFDTTTYTITY